MIVMGEVLSSGLLAVMNVEPVLLAGCGLAGGCHGFAGVQDADGADGTVRWPLARFRTNA
jgi:hypothetical protein